MIKVSNIDVYGFTHAIRGMRNPMNSWNKSDSNFESNLEVGNNDHRLMTKLNKAGSEHAKFMRMIQVWFDVEAPLYWFKQFETYRVRTTSNSCSTMHKLTDKPYELEDFSFDEGTCDVIHRVLLIELNRLRDLYLEDRNKLTWRSMVQLLPSSYNQKRTINLNYEVLKNMYHQRKNHKLSEWEEFFDQVLGSIPCCELITIEKADEERY